MFRQNKRHQQPALISNVNELPGNGISSFGRVVGRDVSPSSSSRLNEEAFAVLCSDLPSRPNVAVNVLVSLDVLKAGYGWSDEELYDHYLMTLQLQCRRRL